MQSSIHVLLCSLLMSALLPTTALAVSKTVLIMGDSLSAAYNIPIDQSWPALFQQKLDPGSERYRVVNASISGETTSGGVERLAPLLKKHLPDYLILELGGNDGLRGFSFKQTQSNLEQMVKLALDSQVPVMLVGVRLPPNLGPVYNRRFQNIYQQVAEKYPVVFLPRFLEGVAADNPDYMQADGIHPTALAQPLLAERVYQQFQSGFIQQLE